MNTNILALASKLILASTTGDDKELQRVSETLAVELTKEHREESGSPVLYEDVTGFLKIPDKEILKMPKSFRHTFRAEGKTICYRKRKRGKISCSYEARYRRHGFNLSVSATDLDELIQKFIAALHAAELGETAPKVPTTFHEFAIFYFNKYRIRTVKERTLKNDMYRYKNHLQPFFKSIPLKLINSDMVQAFVDGYVDKGQIKNAKELNSLLSCIFNNAVNHGILQTNPCKLVILEDYESEHGVALTMDEENKLIESLADNPKYQIPIAVALYAGLRPCEYRTATINGKFIKAECKKQHSKKIIYKYIPIIPRLQKILNGTTEIYFPNIKYIRKKIVAACPGHKPYDLRTTFDTRCEMFKVADIARKFWMGHSIDKLRKAYADLPDEFFLKEAEKLDY